MYMRYNKRMVTFFRKPKYLMVYLEIDDGTWESKFKFRCESIDVIGPDETSPEVFYTFDYIPNGDVFSNSLKKEVDPNNTLKGIFDIWSGYMLYDPTEGKKYRVHESCPSNGKKQEWFANVKAKYVTTMSIRPVEFWLERFKFAFSKAISELNLKVQRKLLTKERTENKNEQV